ncbi:partner and localizer of BRCA2, partial [Silurus meridionalis]
CKPNPSRTHRLRSRRSRLRLQVRERESDPEESQEKTREGTEERWNEERGEKDEDVERGRTEEEEENTEETETVMDGLKRNEENPTAIILPSAAESLCVSQSPSMKLSEGNLPLEDQSAVRTSPPASCYSSSSDRSNRSTDSLGESCSGMVHAAEQTSGSSGMLTSCTLIEGLPFPVEYYIRTTRRMASAHSSVDLNAVIQSQLSNGRGRRRSNRGRGTSRPPSENPPEQSGCRQRGRRGHGRARKFQSSGRSRSLLQSSSSLLQKEPEPVPSPKPSSDPAPESQSHLSSEKSLDPQVYPIFRKNPGMSGSQIPLCTNGSSHLLSSISSLAQGLRTKDFQKLSGLLTKFDVQDFHLPDDEFGQLKLERLCSSCSNVERSCFRTSKGANTSGGDQVEHEETVLSSFPQSASLKSSLPLKFTEQAEMENFDQSECEMRETEDLSNRSVTNQSEMHHNREDVKHTEQIKSHDPHTLSASRSLMLNLSMSLTSHTQSDHNPPVLSLGLTPNVLTTSPSSELMPFLQASDLDAALNTAELQNEEITSGNPPLSHHDSPLSQNNSPLSHHGSPLSQNNPPFFHHGSPLSQHNPPLFQNDLPISQIEQPLSQNGSCLCQNNMGSQHGFSLSQNNSSPSQTSSPVSQNTPLNESALKMNTLDPGESCNISEMDFHFQTPKSRTSHHGNNDTELNNETSALPGVSATRGEDITIGSSLNLVKTHTGGSPNQQREVLSCGSLRKTHSLKALDGGCVLDVCVVRWPSEEDWSVCVAGEWSVCVWKQNPGDQEWSLLYTWTFTQSVISLQGIPDSSALLCVCLGRLEITEARTLYLPGTDSGFSQAELCKGALQAVLAVSDRRVTCCSSPGPQQNIQVFTLAQDGRITETLSLTSTHQTVQTLVVVEEEKDALIGWTEHKSLLIWNMKSAQLLQTIHLAETVSTATCLRGYSYKGALCVLLQQASACHEESSPTLFTLIATNPLTGKRFTLRTITSPSASTERLIDGDVCESALVGVFQSGLAVWSLAGGVACVYANESSEVCRLARWAGPNMLLTGYLNGDVSVYEF